MWKLESYCQTLLINFVVRTQTFQTFTLLDAAGISPTVVLNQNSKSKEEAGSLSIYERQKPQRLYTHGGAAYGSVRNLVKASSLSV